MLNPDRLKTAKSNTKNYPNRIDQRLAFHDFRDSLNYRH